MPFKIVQTIEDSRLCLSIVPSRWEENGKLFWPKSRMSIRKLIKVENSKPEKGKWDELPCVKKREFATLAEAEEEMSHMEEDSETEKDTLPEHLRSRKRQALKPISPLLDLNDLMTENAIEVKFFKLILLHIYKIFCYRQHITIQALVMNYLTNLTK